MGCLLLPFRLLALALVVLALVGVWLYRDRIVHEVRTFAGYEHPGDTGQPSAGALRTARAKLATLSRGTADSVVLDAAEAASLMRTGLDPALRERLDSLSVRLGRGDIAVSGVVRTGRLPADLVGPLAFALRERERVTLGGPLQIVRPGAARWTIDELALRSVPLPRDAVPGLMRRALGDEANGSVGISVPEPVRHIRIEPRSVILYREARP